MDILDKVSIGFQILLLFLLVSYAVLLAFILQESLNKAKRRREEFFTALLNALQKKLISSFEDVINLYKGINRLNSDDYKYRQGLSSLLRRFIIKIVSSQIEGVENKEIIEWKIQLSEYIKKNDELSPYADLPELERSILNDIDAYLDQNDNDSIKRKLKELSSTILTKKDHLLKLEKSNKISNLVAIIGIILTIIFGIISLL